MFARPFISLHIIQAQDFAGDWHIPSGLARIPQGRGNWALGCSWAPSAAARSQISLAGIPQPAAPITHIMGDASLPHPPRALPLSQSHMQVKVRSVDIWMSHDRLMVFWCCVHHPETAPNTWISERNWCDMHHRRLGFVSSMCLFVSVLILRQFDMCTGV